MADLVLNNSDYLIDYWILFVLKETFHSHFVSTFSYSSRLKSSTDTSTFTNHYSMIQGRLLRSGSYVFNMVSKSWAASLIFFPSNRVSDISSDFCSTGSPVEVGTSVDSPTPIRSSFFRRISLQRTEFSLYNSFSISSLSFVEGVSTGKKSHWKRNLFGMLDEMEQLTNTKWMHQVLLNLNLF